jgi:CMP/dCMP kinase
MIITIDGPAASGKSTVARALAQKLHYYYLNSGMLYRALGYCLMHHAEIALEDLRNCDMQTRIHCLKDLQYSYDVSTGIMKIFIEKEDVTASLKAPVIDKAASLVGENKKARDFLLEFQRSIAHMHPNLIAEGRDAGSVVFPQANIKFFLTAHPEVRALRWLNDQNKRGNKNVTFEQAIQTIKDRDARDANRPHAPLKVYADDIIVDNSHFNVEQTLKLILDIIKINQKK